MNLTGKINGYEVDYEHEKFNIILEINENKIFRESYNELKDCDLSICIEKYKKKRGLDANSYFHLLCNKLARHFTISDDDMKIKMNLAYGTLAKDKDGKIIGAKIPKGNDMQLFYPYSKFYKEEDGCDCYMFYKRTHELNTLEFSQLLNGVVQECKDVNIETLGDIQFKAMMEEYDKNKKKD